MPTMTSNELRDLESERESFILHEQRIIQERDEILKNVRDHLDQLDIEIARLGGAARGDAARFHAAALLSSLSKDNGYVPSIEPFPSVKSSSNNNGKKKPRGRPRKSDEGGDSPTDANAPQGNSNDGSGESQKKKRERPVSSKKEVSKHVTNTEKENTTSNNVPFNGEGASPAKKMRISKTSVTSLKHESFDLVRVGDENNRALKEDKAEPWICLCGNQLAADRSRCGKCRRWKGGKRQKRWSLKSRSASPMTGDTAKAKSKSKKTMALKGAIDVYKNATEEKSAADGAMILASMGNFTLNNNPRNEIVYVLGHMVSAVADASGQSKAKAKAPKKKKESAGLSNVIKRKRGRPRKDSNKAHQDLSILRVVSTSDSDSGLTAKDQAAPCKRGRPKKQKEVAEDGQDKKVDYTADASLALKQSQLDAAKEKKTKSALAVADTHVTSSSEEKLKQDETRINTFATEQVSGDFVQSILSSTAVGQS